VLELVEEIFKPRRPGSTLFDELPSEGWCDRLYMQLQTRRRRLTAQLLRYEARRHAADDQLEFIDLQRTHSSRPGLPIVRARAPRKTETVLHTAFISTEVPPSHDILLATDYLVTAEPDETALRCK